MQYPGFGVKERSNMIASMEDRRSKLSHVGTWGKGGGTTIARTFEVSARLGETLGYSKEALMLACLGHYKLTNL